MITYRYKRTAHAAMSLAGAQLVRLRRCCICALALLALCNPSSALRASTEFEANRWRPQIQQIYRSDASLAAAIATLQRCDVILMVTSRTCEIVAFVV